MSDTSTRRSFIRTAGIAGAALATGPTVLHGAAQAGGKVVLAFVGVGHIHTPARVVVMAAMYEAAAKEKWVELS